MSIGPEDLQDAGIVDAAELGSDGTFEYAAADVVAVASGIVEVSGLYLLDPATSPEHNDPLVISGNTGADGAYTVDQVVDNTHFTVNEAISDGTGGTVSFRHPPGATRVGVDPTNLSQSTANELQQVLEDLDYAITGGGITEAQHRILRQLIHFIDDGPAEGFASGAYKETLPSGSPFPTSEIWWESSSKLKKIVELQTTWSGATITQEKWKIYDTDGSTVLWTVTDTINYSGIFETNRTRAIAMGDA